MMRREMAALALAALILGNLGAEEAKTPRAFEEEGDLPKAMELYRALLKDNPPLEEALDAQEGIARILARQGIFEKAATIYRAALARIDEAQALSPTPALSRRGHKLAMRLGDYARAARYCEPLLAETCKPEDRDWALEQTCTCYARQGDWEGLSAFGERYLPTLPKGERRSWLQMVTARAYVRKDKDEEGRAVELYREVIADAPDSPASALAKNRLAALELTNQVKIQLATKLPQTTEDLPAGDDPIDLRRLTEALSVMMDQPHPSPQGLSGFRVSLDNEVVHLTLIGPNAQSQEIALSKLSDLKAGSPMLLDCYRRLQEAPKEAAHPSYLGVSSHPLSPDLAAFLRLSPGAAGVLVDSVAPGSSAEAAGLQAGDVILALNDTKVDQFNLRALVRSIPAGETAKLSILRIGAERKTVEVKTGEPPR